eukprot:11162622-Lingulodinium_polyedra.AAC.1
MARYSSPAEHCIIQMPCAIPAGGGTASSAGFGGSPFSPGLMCFHLQWSPAVQLPFKKCLHIPSVLPLPALSLGVSFCFFGFTLDPSTWANLHLSPKRHFPLAAKCLHTP